MRSIAAPVWLLLCCALLGSTVRAADDDGPAPPPAVADDAPAPPPPVAPPAPATPPPATLTPEEDTDASWIGKVVFRRPGAQARTPTAQTTLDATPVPSMVSKVDGEWLWIGTAWLKKSHANRVDAAIKEYTTAIDGDKKNAMMHYSRGVAYYFKPDYDHAITDMSEAIAHKPDLAAAYMYRGLSYMNKSKNLEALGDLNSTIRLSPNAVDALLGRAKIYFVRRDYDRALADYSQLIQINPTLPGAYIGRGCVSLYAGDYAAAAKDFDEAKSLNSKAASTLYLAGLAKHLDGKSAAAIEELTAAAKAPGNNVTHIGFQGPAQIRGKFEPEKNFKRRSDPMGVVIRDALAWIMATSPDESVRNGKQAIVWAKQAVYMTKGKDSYCLDTLAAAYAEAGDFDAAQLTEAEAIKLATRYTDITGCRERLKLYEKSEPYRDVAETTVEEK